MGDGGPKPNVAEIITQGIVTPIKDEIGKMVEVGVQSITGSTQNQDPQEEAKKKAEDQRKIANIRNFLQQMQVNEQKLRQSKMQEQQLKDQEQQEENQEKQVKKQQQEQKKQAVNQQTFEKQRSTEIRRGVGG